VDAPAQRRRTGLQAVSARLVGPVTLKPQADGTIAACFSDHSVKLGRFSQAAAARAGSLAGGGLVLASVVPPRNAVDTEVEVLLRRLAQHGLLEYAVARARGGGDV